MLEIDSISRTTVGKTLTGRKGGATQKLSTRWKGQNAFLHFRKDLIAKSTELLGNLHPCYTWPMCWIWGFTRQRGGNVKLMHEHAVVVHWILVPTVIPSVFIYLI